MIRTLDVTKAFRATITQKPVSLRAECVNAEDGHWEVTIPVANARNAGLIPGLTATHDQVIKVGGMLSRYSDAGAFTITKIERLRGGQSVRLHVTVTPGGAR